MPRAKKKWALEADSDFYVELEVMEKLGKTIDEWLQKPESVRFVHIAKFRLEKMKEAFAYTPEDKKFGFFAPKP